MFSHFPHTFHHRVAMPVSGSDERRRSWVATVAIGALVASLVGVSFSFGATAEPATAAPGLEAHGSGHHHAAQAGLHVAAGTSTSSTGSAGPDLAAARAGTAAFHRVAEAEYSGFTRLPSGAPLHECIDEDLDLDDADGAAAMGIHWISGERLDGTVSPKSPEVLVYEPQADGSLALVAVEYVVFDSDWSAEQPPELFDRTFHHVTAPNRYGLPSFYALHAWVWQANPAGMFENMNPTVTCADAPAVG